MYGRGDGAEFERRWQLPQSGCLPADSLAGMAPTLHACTVVNAPRSHFSTACRKARADQECVYHLVGSQIWGTGSIPLPPPLSAAICCTNQGRRPSWRPETPFSASAALRGLYDTERRRQEGPVLIVTSFQSACITHRPLPPRPPQPWGPPRTGVRDDQRKHKISGAEKNKTSGHGYTKDPRHCQSRDHENASRKRTPKSKTVWSPA